MPISHCPFALLTGALVWPDLLDAIGATAGAVRLTPWARWITPDWSPKRFDACFFVAHVPAGQEPRWLGGEADRAAWHDVRTAVDAHDDGDLPMLPPTISTLRTLAVHDTVASALASGPMRIGVRDG